MEMMSSNPIPDEPINAINVPVMQPYREKLTLYEIEAPMKGFLKTYRIDGEEGYDQTTFINNIRPKVIKFLSEKKKPFQVKFVLTCRFHKGVSDAEEIIVIGILL